MQTFDIDILGPFTLDTIRTFQCGLFTASRACSLNRDEVKLAIPRDRDFAPVGVALHLERARLVGRTTAHASELAEVKAQVARILCLDHDGRAWGHLLATDPVLAPLAKGLPGYRPVTFHSTWAAAGWAVLSQRQPQKRAAQMARAIAELGGDVVDVDGERLHAFPRPQSILAAASAGSVRGLSAEKWARLVEVARAALDGGFDLERLRTEPREQARARLMKLRGVGPWTADAVLFRGVGPTDWLRSDDETLQRAAAHATGRAHVSERDLEEIARPWAPFRSWATVLLYTALARAGGLTSRRRAG